MLELARSEYVTRRENVIALGNSGTGKTHIALGLGLAACQKGLPVGFTTAAALVNELHEARDEKRLMRLQRQLAGLKLLIVDELDYVPLSPTGAELLFEVFSQRYARGSIIVTSNRRGGRPRIDGEVRDLIRRMSRDNPLWGAPRIHAELLMLGIRGGESTVGRYLPRRRQSPSQGWKTFLCNHAAGIASIDSFVVRTISFRLLYGLVILRHARRRLVAVSVTSNPSAEWIAGQGTDAFPWNQALNI